MNRGAQPGRVMEINRQTINTKSFLFAKNDSCNSRYKYYEKHVNFIQMW